MGEWAAAIVLGRIDSCGREIFPASAETTPPAVMLKPKPHTNASAAAGSYLAALMQDY
jgi:hypothetical protein